MKLEYRVVRSSRKTTSLEINRAGEVVVRCPLGMPEEQIAALVEQHRAWLEQRLAQIPKTQPVQKLTPEELQALGKRAVEHFPERVAHFAAILGVSYGRITIRTQKTKWGSCSSKANLNFNVLLMLAPPMVLDYIVIHELCHRKHMNHSAALWAEVEGVMPNYRQQEKWLKEHGSELMMQLWD